MPRLSRPERLERAEAAARDRIVLERKRLSTIQSQQRAESRKAQQRRILEVGRLAAEAGLLSLDDALLAEMFALVSQVAQSPDPEATLAELMWHMGSAPGTPLEMSALRTE